MKILHWTFIFVAIILPISIICRVTVNSRFMALRDEVRINNAIDTATKDAIDQIIVVSDFTPDDQFGNVINVTPELAQESINTFFHTLAVNYNIPFKPNDSTLLNEKSSDSDIKNYFAPYVPAVIVIAYDGFYIYSQELAEGGYEYKLSSKIPYAYENKERGYSIGYTLGNDVYLYIDGKCYSGRLNYNSIQEIKNAFEANGYNDTSLYPNPDSIANVTSDLSMFLYAYINSVGKFDAIGNDLLPLNGSKNYIQDYKFDEISQSYTVGAFHKKRREVIIKTISDCLRQEINVDHNRFAHMMGSIYDFYLPEITNDDWINSINDISVMAFVQGIPVGTLSGHYFNNFALGGSQIVNRDFIYGNTIQSKHTGNLLKIYHKKEKCKGITEYGNKREYDEIFLTEEDAVKSGYLPCQLCN